MNPLATIGDAARSLVRQVLHLYYPRIEIEGRERIPRSGAVLFVANHPNSLMDPAVIGYTAQRPVHFFAKAPLFEVPVFGALMHALGMVPAHRGQDDKAAVRKNLETLELGAQDPARGEAVGIFPEGKSHDREGVEQVRTGAARIAASAVARGAALTIVPLGLNYERKERFRSSIWARVGEPIDAAGMFGGHAGEERQVMRRLTEEIDARLRQAVVHLDDERWRPFLDELEVLLPAGGDEARDPIAALRQRKRLADAVNYFVAADGPRATGMAAAMERHRAELAAAGLEIESAAVQVDGARLGWRLTQEALWLLPGLLPAVAGTLHHLVPFAITRGIVTLVKHPGRATVALNRLLIGLPVYGLWYGLVWWWLAAHVAMWFAWLWTALAPLAGVGALHYAWRMRRAGRAWWSGVRMTTRRAELERLRAQQRSLRGQLERLRDEYRARKPDLTSNT